MLFHYTDIQLRFNDFEFNDLSSTPYIGMKKSYFWHQNLFEISHKIEVVDPA